MSRAGGACEPQDLDEYAAPSKEAKDTVYLTGTNCCWAPTHHDGAAPCWGRTRGQARSRTPTQATPPPPLLATTVRLVSGVSTGPCTPHDYCPLKHLMTGRPFSALTATLALANALGAAGWWSSFQGSQMLPINPPPSAPECPLYVQKTFVELIWIEFEKRSTESFGLGPAGHAR